jgi:methyl-accepting chemotaxis protein
MATARSQADPRQQQVNVMPKLPAIPLRYKLPAIVVGFSLSVAIILQVYVYLAQRQQVLDWAETQFTRLTMDRHYELDHWLEERLTNVRVLAANPTTREAIERIGTSFAGIPANPTSTLQDTYITNNPHPPEDRQLMVSHDGPLSYFRQHAVYHPAFTRLKELLQFDDIFLLDLNGNVIYSVRKNEDFAANVNDGPLAETGLAEAYRGAMNGAVDHVAATDFLPYAPAGARLSGFMAQKVIGPNGDGIGVVAIKLPGEHLTSIVLGKDDLGLTGDAYLVGPDLRARSNSRFDERFSAMDQLEATPVLNDLFAGRAGFYNDIDLPSGNRGIVETMLLETPGGTWGLVVERDMAEVVAPTRAMLIRMLEITAVTTIAVLLLGTLIARSITRPLTRIGSAMSLVAKGELAAEVPYLSRKDELGQIAQDLDDLRQRLVAAETLREEREAEQAAQHRVVEALSLALQGLSAGDLTRPIEQPFAPEYEALRLDFNATLERLDDIILQVVETAASIRARSDEINSASEDLSHRTENQAAALEETAAALDQLTASVRSAADGAREVETIVRQARSEAEESGTVVQGAVAAMTEIEKSSEHISQIIGVIDDIAFQTSLLALNAGVEAARAGDAGRGFAVVASEVRALAQRSSAAAKEIKTLIGASTQHVGRGVDQVGRAGKALASIVDRVAHISTLVSEIASGAAEQSTGLAEINIGVTQLDQVTQKNAAMVEEATAASNALHHDATALGQLVSTFTTPGSATAATSVIDMARPSGAAFVPREAGPIMARASAASAASAGGRSVWQDF